MFNLFQFIKTLFTKKEEILKSNEIYNYKNDYVSPSNFMMSRNNIEVIVPDINIKNNVGKNAPTILIMDDYSGMVDLLYSELPRIQCSCILETFNIITATEEYAAFTVKNYIDQGRKIDIAFLDITIGGIIKGVELDGIDIALIIKEHNPDAVIKFITGHALNRRNPEIFEFMEKFYIQTGYNIDEEEDITQIKNKQIIRIKKHIIGKNSNRVMLMGITIEQWLKRHNKIDLNTGYMLTTKE